MLLSKEIESYIENHSSHEDELLHQLFRTTHLKTIYPRMISGKVQGQFLQMISSMLMPKKALEIGTFTGYGSICIARGLAKNGMLHTIEINRELTDISRPFFEKAGLSEKITQHIGKAEVIIPDIDAAFDLVFIDGDKEAYVDYFNIVFPKLKTGGYILADNALWDGKVVFDENPDKETRGIIEFNRMILKDTRVLNVLVPIRDGIMFIKKLSD